MRLNRLGDKRDIDSAPQEIEIESELFTVFHKSFGNPVMNMLKYFSEDYECDERTYIDKESNEVVSLCRNLLTAHNISGFDSGVVLNSLDKETTDFKIKELLEC